MPEDSLVAYRVASLIAYWAVAYPVEQEIHFADSLAAVAQVVACLVPLGHPDPLVAEDSPVGSLVAAYPAEQDLRIPNRFFVWYSRPFHRKVSAVVSVCHFPDH